MPSYCALSATKQEREVLDACADLKFPFELVVVEVILSPFVIEVCLYRVDPSRSVFDHEKVNKRYSRLFSDQIS